MASEGHPGLIHVTFKSLKKNQAFRCKKCFPDRKQMAFGTTTMSQLYYRTMQKIHRLVDYLDGKREKLHIVWEHAFDYEIEHNEELRNFVSNLKITEEMDSRSAYYGIFSGFFFADNF